MDFFADALTDWTGFLNLGCSHMYLKASICLLRLAQNLEVRQVQRHQNALGLQLLSLLLGLYGMLISHDLSSRSFGVFVLTKSHEGQVDCSLSSLFFPSFPRKDGDPFFS